MIGAPESSHSSAAALRTIADEVQRAADRLRAKTAGCTSQKLCGRLAPRAPSVNGLRPLAAGSATLLVAAASRRPILLLPTARHLCPEATRKSCPSVDVVLVCDSGHPRGAALGRGRSTPARLARSVLLPAVLRSELLGECCCLLLDPVLHPTPSALAFASANLSDATSASTVLETWANATRRVLG